MLEPDNEWTILDYLNEDCWRAVLRYVPVHYIIRSESVSRRWQRVVLLYLQGIRFMFETLEENDHANCSHAYVSRYGLNDSTYESFVYWTNKLGATVVGTYCTNEENLKILRENCPNIEALTYFELNETKSHNLNEDFKKLQQLCFDKCHNVSDQFVGQNISDKVLDELLFYHCYDVTGQWLTSANLSKVNTLIFDSCFNLQATHLVSSANQLVELTRLELIDVPLEIAEEIQLVLDKMPKLEWLEIHSNGKRTNQCYLTNYKPLCRLSHLDRLSIDLKVNDIAVAAIMCYCKQLDVLKLWDCVALTPLGLRAICHFAGARLYELQLNLFHSLTDDDVVHCVRSCPELSELTLGGLCQITPALLPRVSATRHQVSPKKKLLLVVIETRLTDQDYLESVRGNYEEMRVEYEDLNVAFTEGDRI